MSQAKKYLWAQIEKKIFDSSGGQIDNSSTWKYLSFPFLIATLSTQSFSEGLLELMMTAPQGPTTNLVRCFHNYKDSRYHQMFGCGSPRILLKKLVHVGLAVCVEHLLLILEVQS